MGSVSNLPQEKKKVGDMSPKEDILPTVANTEPVPLSLEENFLDCVKLAAGSSPNHKAEVRAALL